MIVEIRNSFKKDTEKLPPDVKIKLFAQIELLVHSEKLSQLSNCKKLKGDKSAFRIKLNRYRIGLYYRSNLAELVRVLDRKDIYKYFP